MTIENLRGEIDDIKIKNTFLSKIVDDMKKISNYSIIIDELMLLKTENENLKQVNFENNRLIQSLNYAEHT